MTIVMIGTESKTESNSPFKSQVPAFPLDFARALRDICDLRLFVETGTYKGDTALAMAYLFDHVISIEGVKERFEATGRRKDLPDNVNLLFGPSEEVLGEILTRFVYGSALIYLDAHWIHCGNPIEQDEYQGDLSHCPLLMELAQIPHDKNYAIVIDDAHFFMHPPIKRGDPAAWPSLDQVMTELIDHYVFVNAGMLVAVPERHRKAVQDWLVANWTTWRQFG